MKKARNPEIRRAVGPMQPDLFGGESENVEVEYLPLEDMTDEEIAELPFKSFLPEELGNVDTEVLQAIIKRDRVLRKDIPEEAWDELTEKEQRVVRENDPDSAQRIEDLVNKFVGRYKDAMEPDERYVLDSANDRDDLSSFLSENADHLVSHARRAGSRRDGEEIDSILEALEAAGHDEASAERALDEVMQDVDNYDVSVSDDYTRAFYKTSVSTGYVNISYSDVEDLVQQMSDEELEEAVEEIHRQTDGVYKRIYVHWKPVVGNRKSEDLSSSMLRDKRFSVDQDFDAHTYVDWEPDWAKIRAAALDIELPEDAGPPRQALDWGTPEERRVLSFPDGFYVQDLSPSEMADEGRVMGFCIGQRQYGYMTAVEKGQAKAFSLRTPAGRPKLTAFVEYEGRGDKALIRAIPQIKGKGNRLPGYNLGDAGGKISHPDEVAKIIEFVASIGWAPDGVGDLRPAMKEFWKLIEGGDPWAVKIQQRALAAQPKELEAEGVEVLSQPPIENPRKKFVEYETVCEKHGTCGVGFCEVYRPSRGR